MSISKFGEKQKITKAVEKFEIINKKASADVRIAFLCKKCGNLLQKMEGTITCPKCLTAN